MLDGTVKTVLERIPTMEYDKIEWAVDYISREIDAADNSYQLLQTQWCRISDHNALLEAANRNLVKRLKAQRAEMTRLKAEFDQAGLAMPPIQQPIQIHEV